ncbi:hypothetical protein SEA_KUWABARA_40 [Gordonia phage Kuwabara]|nr:hypothetical protein SEA_KUWABARA_40 [Gordonia phage Kuwabara]
MMPEFWIGDRVAEPGLISPGLRAVYADVPEGLDWDHRDHEWAVEIGDGDA